VLLKRGMATSIQEWLLSAEYVLSGGNPNVILCERGIRTFKTSTRFTLDLNAVPVLKKLTHLPVFVDPSHGTGHWEYVESMARAGVAAGADGLIIDVHPRPAEALSDGPQSLKPDRFASVTAQLRRVAPHGQPRSTATAGGQARAARAESPSAEAPRRREPSRSAGAASPPARACASDAATATRHARRGAERPRGGADSAGDACHARTDATGTAPAVAERHASSAVTAGATSGRRAAALCPDAAACRYPVGVATGWRRRRHDWRPRWDRRRADSAQLDGSELQRLPRSGAPTDQAELGIPLRQERRNTRVRVQDRVPGGRVRH